MQVLKDAHWIDEHTRHLYIEVVLFNAPTQLFVVLSIHFEVLPQGILIWIELFKLCVHVD